MTRPDPPQPVAEEGLWIAHNIKGKAVAGRLAPDGFAGDDEGGE